MLYSKNSSTFASANTGVAQLVEHRSPKPGVGSSSLSSRANIASCEWIIHSFFYMKGQIKDYYNEVLTHYTWKFIIGIRCNRHLLTSSPNNSFLVIIRCIICSKFRKTLPMAHQPKISRNIHPQLQRTSCHPLTGKNHFNYHDMDYTNLLLHHHQWYNLD